MACAAQQAVALAQQEKSTWTRADVIKYLGRVLPRSGPDPAAAAALLEDLADRALRSEFEPVICLEAPEPVRVPASLLRADGRSVYQRHGGVRYATREQLAMEERMVAQAGASGTPRMDRAQAAHALGADPAELEETLTGHAEDANAPHTQSGLCADQAAAAWSVLTDGKLVSVINAPAGSGKTRVLAEAARIWEAAGLGPVIGITPSQSARNTLAAGVPKRRRHVPARQHAWLRTAGRPARFRAAWEQQASLRLRDGDTAVLAEWDRHGRVISGEPEQMMDAAAAAYVALSADGTDVLLMAADHTLRRELSRRIRGDLIQLGIVAAGPAVRIADGAQDSPGDLILCAGNDHSVEAGERGRTLANGDLLRIDAVTRSALIVRRALDADPRTRGSGAGPAAPSCTQTTPNPSWATRSPTIPPRAGPCTPAWP